jgi:hypothetical protein
MEETTPARREELLLAIAEQEARLAHLEVEQADSRQRLAAMQAELASLGAEPGIRVRLPLASGTAVPKTSAEKVKLFRSLFRGPEDVFPTRFVSKKTGKPGYAPACRNKFVKGVCELPKVKCGECQNQAFIAFDDAAVVGHLTGRHVMGVYPLLDDETCWFLAVDFDKGTWTEDLSAFIETCRRVARGPDAAPDVREAVARVPRDRLRARRGATRLCGAWRRCRHRVRRGRAPVAQGQGRPDHERMRR